MSRKIPVGISACLLGDEVRYNGGHKKSKFCVEHLANVFDFHSFCPELAIGLGVPREPIRLVAKGDAYKVIGTVNRDLDVTEAISDYGKEIAEYAKNLSGYIFMPKSPSCGVYSAKIYKSLDSKMGVISGKHAGAFAKQIMICNPLLPVEEDGRLLDARLRENFIARVYLYDDWQETFKKGIRAKELIEFHSRHKYLLLAHSQRAYRKLGGLLSNLKKKSLSDIAEKYINICMEGMSRPASRNNHVNTLLHVVGYLRDTVPGPVRQKLVESISDYQKEQVNLSVPVTMLKHYIDMHGSDYIRNQSYLEPYDRILGLRNSI